MRGRGWLPPPARSRGLVPAGLIAGVDDARVYALRTDFRSFRLDRIREPVLAAPFVDEPGKTLETFIARMQDSA